MPPEAVAALALVDHSNFKDMTQQEVLEDLSSRFILNLPDTELESIERICFQVEQAHWYYEDFVREENRAMPSLPLKKFSAMLFRACPMLRQWTHDHEVAFDNFMQYKTRVPVCGAVMLNDALDKCILVKGWKSSSGWGFPKGKINQQEDAGDCAIREVLEETGYDLTDRLRREDNVKLIIREQAVTLFFVTGVPEDTVFQTRTRKEISKIEWFKLVDLPTWKRNRTAPGKFYLISPFIGPLKEFITQRKAGTPSAKSRRKQRQQQPELAPPESLIDNLFARITTGTPAPSSSEASSSDHDPGISTGSSPSTSRSSDPPLSTSAPTLSTSDPHFQRLLSSLGGSRAETPTSTVLRSPGQNQTPQALNDLLQPPPTRSSQPTPSAYDASSSASQSPTDPDEQLVKKRQKHLALLESVSEEIAHQAMATPQPPHSQLLPGPRPATTSPVKAFHPFHAHAAPPQFMTNPMQLPPHLQQQRNGFHGPFQPPYPNSLPPLANGMGPSPLALNGHGPLHSNGFVPAMNGMPPPPHSAMAGPLPPLGPNGFQPLNLNGAGRMGPGIPGLPISPVNANGFNIGPPPAMMNGFPNGRPHLAPLQSLAFNQARFGGPIPPLSAGATMPMMQQPSQQHQQQQHLLSILHSGRMPTTTGPPMQMQMQMQGPMQPAMPMLPRPSTTVAHPGAPMNANQTALLNILNGGPRL